MANTPTRVEEIDATFQYFIDEGLVEEVKPGWYRVTPKGVQAAWSAKEKIDHRNARPIFVPRDN